MCGGDGIMSVVRMVLGVECGRDINWGVGCGGGIIWVVGCGGDELG